MCCSTILNSGIGFLKLCIKLIKSDSNINAVLFNFLFNKNYNNSNHTNINQQLISKMYNK